MTPEEKVVEKITNKLLEKYEPKIAAWVGKIADKLEAWLDNLLEEMDEENVEKLP